MVEHEKLSKYFVRKNILQLLFLKVEHFAYLAWLKEIARKNFSQGRSKINFLIFLQVIDRLSRLKFEFDYNISQDCLFLKTRRSRKKHKLYLIHVNIGKIIYE